MLPLRYTYYLLCLLSCTSYAATNQIKANKNTITPSLCYVPQQTFVPVNKSLVDSDSISITSNSSVIEKNEIAKFIGDVTLSSQDQHIMAESLEFNRTTSSFIASGNIEYQNAGINVFADKLTSTEIDVDNKDKKNNTTELVNSSYQFTENAGHGAADSIKVNQNGTLTLSNSSFTTCYEEVPAWQIVASKIKISSDENTGEAYNARLHILNVPVLYIPYFNFPISDKRKSGFLYPTFSSSSDLGAEIATPFYWNIAENYDATITPRYLSKRGLQIQTEFRYLSGTQQGEFNIEYLNNDRDSSIDDARYLARLEHSGTFAENYRIYIDATTVSDDNYLNDIGSEHYNSNDAYLYQVGELSYYNNGWSIVGKLQDFEIVGNNEESYKTLPQIEINKTAQLGYLNSLFTFNSEISAFTIDNSEAPEAERYHVEAGLLFPVSKPGWFINSEVKLLSTYYQQRNIAQDSQLESSVSRTLPKVRIHGGINLERKLSFGGFTQTLEPQLQYLYIPERDQSAIGIYDSAPLQDDFDGLFRDIRFTGLDRVAAADQYSWGITSRILTSSNHEVFRFSLGRIVFLGDESEFLNSDDLGVTLLNNSPTQQFSTSGKSSLAAETFFQINNQWQFNGDIQYNTEIDKTDKSQLSLDYQRSEFVNIQLNHRYIRDVSGFSIEQLSLLTNIKINQDWQFVGRITQDLQQDRSIETFTGFQYESCCWAVRFAYHRNIDSFIDDNDDTDNNFGEFDSSFMIQFVIKGLNGPNSSLKAQDTLDDSIFGYKRPYFLNN